MSEIYIQLSTRYTSGNGYSAQPMPTNIGDALETTPGYPLRPFRYSGVMHSVKEILRTRITISERSAFQMKMSDPEIWYYTWFSLPLENMSSQHKSTKVQM
jgi:hypothetical protein